MCLYSVDFPDSHWQCYIVKWDSNSEDFEHLSPWDMEPIPENHSADKTPGKYTFMYHSFRFNMEMFLCDH